MALEGTVFGMPKKAAVVVGAGAAVFVGYMYWKSSTGAAPAVVDPTADIGATDYVSPLGSTGTNSTLNQDSTDPDAIDTNAKWTQQVVELLSQSGWDSAVVTVAIGKWLNFEGLTPNEHTIVVAAKGVAGDPPVGGPYPLKDALPTTGGTTTTNPNGIGHGWHKVSPGASPQAIAKNYGITLAQFYAWNGTNALKTGEWVKTSADANPASGYKG